MIIASETMAKTNFCLLQYERQSNVGNSISETIGVVVVTDRMIWSRFSSEDTIKATVDDATMSMLNKYIKHLEGMSAEQVLEEMNISSPSVHLAFTKFEKSDLPAQSLMKRLTKKYLSE